MMKYFFIALISVFFAAPVFSQGEGISPLNGNFELQKKHIIQRSFADIFVYSIDTIEIPFMDDFSRDRFKAYDAQPGDPGVTSQEYFRLLDAAAVVVLNDTVKYMRNPTYFITYDSIAGALVQTQTPLDSIQITINTLTSYPINNVLEYVYPRYYILDTLWQPSSPDTIYIPNPDLVQDSVMVYFVDASGDNSLWQDRYAYRNNRYPIAPPTIGVATMDGLDENGFPYDFINTTLTGICDYLTSKPINLDLKPSLLPYTAADSIYLSFFYQQTGRGNQPEAGDSLFLEFWSPSVGEWYPQWSTPGAIAVDTFQQVLVPVTLNIFLEDGFKFRFKNRGNLSGSLDHWHIDYVFLNANRNRYDTIRPDVAFQYDLVSILKDYSQMPWSHFLWDPAGAMCDTVSVYQRNNDAVAKIIVSQQMEVTHLGVPQGTITSPNIPNVSALSNFSSLYDVDASGFVFDTSLADSCSVIFDIAASFNPGSNFQLNDTLHFQQVFADQYAYDDGTAEAAYGPQGVGAFLAYKFSIPQVDTLRSIRMHFEPSVNNATGHPFFLYVWDATGPGTTPGTVLSQNTTFHFPEYVNEHNGFYEYALDAPVAVSGTFFVGWKQLDVDKLNIGFDYNTNAQSKIYYKTAANWIQTGFQGALMMRPVFDRCIGDVTSVNEIPAEELHFSVYPNPNSGEFFVEGSWSRSEIRIIDLSGRLVMQLNASSRERIDLSMVENGIYLVEVISSEGQRGVQKIVLQK